VIQTVKTLTSRGYRSLIY